MSSYFLYIVSVIFLSASAACSVSAGSSAPAPTPTPAAVKGVKTGPSPASGSTQTAVFAGGCFWGVEAVFEHVKGVKSARSGYAGGSEKDADYDKVSDGGTGHAEAVEVTFDPAAVSYGQLLQIFFSVVHDPTQLNRQGPDTGTQYRSAIFYTGDEQKAAAEKYIGELTAAKAYGKEKIVTQVTPLDKFYEAEAYHQDYMKKNPADAYIVYHDIPKVKALEKKFADLYVAAY